MEDKKVLKQFNETSRRRNPNSNLFNIARRRNLVEREGVIKVSKKRMKIEQSMVKLRPTR